MGHVCSYAAVQRALYKVTFQKTTASSCEQPDPRGEGSQGRRPCALDTQIFSFEFAQEMCGNACLSAWQGRRRLPGPPGLE